MSGRILCSTGALIGIPNGRDYRLLSGCAENLRCDGYEFMMYSTWYPCQRALVAFLHSLPIRFYVMHCEKSVGEKLSAGDVETAFHDFRENCMIANAIGADKMVLHLWNGKPSDQKIENHLAAYPDLKKEAARCGIELTVENVVCTNKDPLTHFRSLLSLDKDVRFTWDTKLAAFHGQTDALYDPDEKWLWDHISHMHLNDYNGGYASWGHLQTLHIGQGNVDFDRLFAFLPETGYRGDYTVEATSFLPDGIIRWQDLNETFDKIRAHVR